MTESNLTHEWLPSNTDALAGRWVGQTGDVLCEWHWHTPSQQLTIAASGVEQSIALNLGDHFVQIDRLKAVIPDIARDAAGRRKRSRPKTQWAPIKQNATT